MSPALPLPTSALRRVCAAVLAVAVPVGAAGCAAGQTIPPASTLPQPAPLVSTVEPGRQTRLFALELTLFDTQATTPRDGVARVLATVRTANTSTASWTNPDTQLVCANADRGGDWYRDSTWEPNGLLPAGVVAEGQVRLGFPPDPGAVGVTVARCDNARIRFRLTDLSTRQEGTVEVPVPAAVIDGALAAR